MNRLLRAMQFAIVSAGVLGAAIALATFAAHQPRGTKIVSIPVPGKNAETCVVPKHFPDALYQDKDAEAEAKLCALDENTNAAVCPKTNSTNPGLDWHSVPDGSTIAQITGGNCKNKDAKKVAKYKLSSSCSYTPSILGYYHLSRILGGIGDVPPSVIRTYDLQNHIALGRKALAETPANQLIHQTWMSLMAQLTAGPNATRRDLLLTDDFKQSYGALSINPKKEEIYHEFFNGGANPQAKATNFRDKNPIMALVAHNGDIDSLVGREFNAANVQKMVQMQDVADMIVIDTLMSQQDRFGNVAELEFFYYQDPKDLSADGSKKVKVSKDKPDDPQAAASAFQIKKMLLKDNDCGVTKENAAKEAGLADHIAHINPETYKRLRKLDQIADSSDTKSFFMSEVLFTPTDYSSFRRNLHDVATKLHKACTQGHLRPDLDLDAHFSGKPSAAPNCEVH
ncbi:MAG TPA: hypothetical protein VMT61_07235 [Candidatus Binataceae bacterium]|nr:hypothetical protein [Candidatus Binataceae bacterium]